MAMAMSEELIARLEKATGPDRELDCKIWLALFDKQVMVDGGGYSPNARPPKYESARKIWTDDWPGWTERTQVEHGVAIELDCPRFTGSLDAALMLVTEGCGIEIGFPTPGGNGKPWADVWWGDDPEEPRQIHENAATLPLALSIAALKARSAS
jgi:hypothetical protein